MKVYFSQDPFHGSPLCEKPEGSMHEMDPKEVASESQDPFKVAEALVSNENHQNWAPYKAMKSSWSLFPSLWYYNGQCTARTLLSLACLGQTFN